MADENLSITTREETLHVCVPHAISWPKSAKFFDMVLFLIRGGHFELLIHPIAARNGKFIVDNGLVLRLCTFLPDLTTVANH